MHYVALLIRVQCSPSVVLHFCAKNVTVCLCACVPSLLNELLVTLHPVVQKLSSETAVRHLLDSRKSTVSVCIMVVLQAAWMIL